MEEEHESLEPESVAPKATWGGSSLGPKEPPFPATTFEVEASGTVPSSAEESEASAKGA